jgi:UDP-GlcNAc:undecaprenyl-phosphate GlcNAc-1-phosphate transferase
VLESSLTSPQFIEGAIVFAVAFLVTVVMVPASHKIAVLIGAIDYPSNRRINTKPIPRCGGIAMYAGFMVASVVVYVGVRYFSWQIVDYYVVENMNYAVMLIGLTVMFLTGLIDDIIQLTPKVKFAGQVLAALLVALSGVSIDMVRSPIDNSYLSLGFLDIPITVLYLVAFANIINLIDGLDGLAAGIVGISAFSMLLLVAMRGSFSLALMCLMLVAVCVAFLFYNFYPASIFMGDSGALFLGLVLGLVSISGVVRTQSLIIMVVPLVMAGVPVLDTFSAIVRRHREHKHFDEADMGHIHHRLVDAGYSQRKAVLILYACTAALAAVGLAVMGQSGIARWITLGVLLVVVAFIIWRCGLFRPVLQHYYVGRGKTGTRKPRSPEDAQKIIDATIPIPSKRESEADASPAHSTGAHAASHADKRNE